jgi:hypothetical protein
MWRLPTPERLARWKNFREEIGSLPFEQALDATASLWNKTSFTPFYLEHHNVDSWPDPWTMITENYYCDLAKSLGMLYTLYLSQHRDHEYNIRVFTQSAQGTMYNLVWIDQGKYVLNLEPEQHVNKKSIPSELKQIIEYTSLDLKLDRY